jgi:hypothetical protein
LPPRLPDVIDLAAAARVIAKPGMLGIAEIER